MIVHNLLLKCTLIILFYLRDKIDKTPKLLSVQVKQSRGRNLRNQVFIINKATGFPNFWLLSFWLLLCLNHYSKRIGDVDRGGVANSYTSFTSWGEWVQ